MCGIVGFIGSGNGSFEGKLDQALLSRMQDRIAHRGRDACGTVYFDGKEIARTLGSQRAVTEKRGPTLPRLRVGLGHQRLTIVDQTERGTQPLVNEDETVFLICNGEVYNHKALRSRLEKLGHRFRSDSDSETIIHLYEEYGVSGFEEIVGPNAFCLWDSRRNIFMLHRDRFGEKPLYYYFGNGAFIFSSEIKSFLEFRELGFEVSPEAVSSYFTLGHVAPPFSWFKEIQKVRCGHLLLCDGEKLEDRLAWTPKFPRRIPRPLEDGLDEFDELFKRVVGEVAYVEPELKCGIPISGGIDSSLLCLYANSLGLPFDKFTLYEERSVALEDELSRAKFVSSFTPGRHVVVGMERNLPALLEASLGFIDEPITSLLDVAIRFVFYRELGKHVRVMIGAGFSDFVFQSLARFHETMRQDRLRSGLLGDATRLIPRALKRAFASSSGKRSALFFTPEGYGVSYYREQARPFSFLLGPEIHEEVVGREMGRALRELDPPDVTAAMLLLSIVALRQYTLYMDDHIGLTYGVEARDPFLDVRLLGFALSLPFELLIPDYKEKPWNPSSPTNKYLLRKALERMVGPGPSVSGAKYGWGKDKDAITAYQVEVSLPGAAYDLTRNEFLLEGCHLNAAEVVKFSGAFSQDRPVQQDPFGRLAMLRLAALNCWTRFHPEYRGSATRLP